MTSEGNGLLAGAQTLLLEDDALINLSTTEMIEQMGCTVRSYMSVEDGIAAARELLPDVAVLDVNIRGKARYELAEFLQQRNVPIIFVTGYDNPAIDGRWRGIPVCRKPCVPSQLKEILMTVLTGRRQRGDHPPP